METSRSSLKDIPQEFKLAAYDRCHDFKLREWVMSFQARCLRIQLLGSAIRSRDAQARKDCAFAAEFLLENPMWPVDIIRMGEFVTNSGTVVNARFSHCEDHTVLYRFMSVSDINDERYKKYATEYIKEMEEFDSGDRELLDIPVWKMEQELGFFSSDEPVLVEVDLRGSEDRIVSDFVSWLRVTRSALGIALPKAPATDKDFKRWASLKLLAYLDLKFWADTHETKFTNHLLGDALFPDEVEVALAERIRKVVAPLAQEVVREEYTDMLAFQWGQEDKNVFPTKYTTWTGKGTAGLVPTDWREKRKR